MPRRSRRPLPRGFGTIWTAVAVDLVGFGIVFPILPVYARRFHASPLAATGLVAAFSVASFMCSPLWGRLSDRIGRRPVLVLSLAGTAAGSLLTGAAGGLALLYLGRLVDGASGASVSVAQAAVADVADEEDRPRLFGLLGAAFGLGFVAGPALGALASLVGPRVPFFLAAAVAGVNALIATRRLPETRATRTDAAAPIQGPEERSGRAPAWISLRYRHRAAVLASGEVRRLVLTAFLALVAFSGFEATFALFARIRLGLSQGSIGAVFTVVGLIIVGVQTGLVRPVVAALGEVPTLCAGLILDGAGLALLAGAHGWLVAAPALLALTVGQGLVQTTLTSSLAGRADPDRRGEVLGVQQSAGGLARVLGPLAGGALLGHVATAAPYLAGAAIMLAGALVAVGAMRPVPTRAG